MVQIWTWSSVIDGGADGPLRGQARRRSGIRMNTDANPVAAHHTQPLTGIIMLSFSRLYGALCLIFEAYYWVLNRALPATRWPRRQRCERKYGQRFGQRFGRLGGSE